MGGTSMLFTAVSLGIILAVSSNNQKNKDAAGQLVDTQNEDQAL
jgi:cell division protein FtsW (lipid II flippase)